MKTISIHTRLTKEAMIYAHQALISLNYQPATTSDLIRTTTQLFTSSILGTDFWNKPPKAESVATIERWLSKRPQDSNRFASTYLKLSTTLSPEQLRADKISSSFSPEDAEKATRVLAFLKAGTTTIAENLSSDNELLREITAKLIELFPDLMAPQTTTVNPQTISNETSN